MIGITWAYIIEWVTARINDVKNWATGLFAKITYVWNVVVTAVKNWALSTFAKIGEFVNNITNYIYNVYNTVKNYITEVYETIVNNISNVYNTVKNYFTNVYNTVVNNITEVIGVTIEKVGEWFAEIGGATRSWVDGLFVKAKNVWNTISGNVDNWWKTQLASINEVFGWINVFHDEVVEFFTDPLEWVYKKIDEFFERYW